MGVCKIFLFLHCSFYFQHLIAVFECNVVHLFIKTIFIHRICTNVLHKNIYALNIPHLQWARLSHVFTDSYYFYLFSIETGVTSTHWNQFGVVLRMSTYDLCFYEDRSIIFCKLFPNTHVNWATSSN